MSPFDGCPPPPCFSLFFFSFLDKTTLVKRREMQTVRCRFVLQQKEQLQGMFGEEAGGLVVSEVRRRKVAEKKKCFQTSLLSLLCVVPTCAAPPSYCRSQTRCNLDLKKDKKQKRNRTARVETLVCVGHSFIIVFCGYMTCIWYEETFVLCLLLSVLLFFFCYCSIVNALKLDVKYEEEN